MGRFGFTKSIVYLALTHWVQDKMAAIFQTTFLNAFSWMKMYDFILIFHSSLFQRVQLIILQLWFSANQVRTHYLNQWWLIYWHIYGSLSLNELKPSDAIWRHRTGSALAQVMACCLVASSHYENQFWLIISEVFWCSSEAVSQGILNTCTSLLDMSLKITN